MCPSGLVHISQSRSDFGVNCVNISLWFNCDFVDGDCAVLDAYDYDDEHLCARFGFTKQL